MMDKATGIVADMIAANYMARLSKGPIWTTTDDIVELYRAEATAIIDALKAHQFAVIELPEPNDKWACGPEWRPFPDTRTVVWTGPPGSRVMVQNVEPGDLYPAEARKLAAALLAAAQKAETQ